METLKGAVSGKGDGAQGLTRPTGNGAQGLTRPTTGIVMRDPMELRAHPLRKRLPATVKDSVEWHSFVDGLSAIGAENCPPLICTPEGLVMDGWRRVEAAKQLQWASVPTLGRPEEEAATIIVESLLGQRSLSKGAKVYLMLGLYDEYAEAAMARRLNNLKIGRKTLEKANDLPKAYSVGFRKAADQVAERLGCSQALVEHAVRIRKAFEAAKLKDHKFLFQDGQQKTLREHFEPLILDSESPMGLGEVIKGIGYFVDESGEPREQAPAARNSHLFYWQRSWASWGKGCTRWEDLGPSEQAEAVAAVKEAARLVPAEVLDLTGEIFSEEKKRRKKAEKRATAEDAEHAEMAESR